MHLEPVIKWSGSKRSQAAEIIMRMPRKIDTYYEPFCGGASVLYRLLQTPQVKVMRYICSDVNSDLIDLWCAIKEYPEVLAERYAELWKELNKDADLERRKQYFYEVRENFNNGRSPYQFLFLLRTCINGMPRYNSSGKFNTSLHFSRNGIEPTKLMRILRQWSDVLNQNHVEFVCRSYNESIIEYKEGDFVYCDPPYASVKGKSMYHGGIDKMELFNWLRGLNCRWALSFDGRRGDNDFTVDVPNDLYVRHEYLNSGTTSFVRYLGNRRVEDVQESLYLNYEPGIGEQLKQGVLFDE